MQFYSEEIKEQKEKIETAGIKFLFSRSGKERKEPSQGE